MQYTHPISQVSDLPRIGSKTPLILDTEATGLHKINDHPFMVLVGIRGKYYAVDDMSKMIMWLEDHLTDCKEMVCHNAKYDLNMLYNAGLKKSTIQQTPIWCSYVAGPIIDENRFEYSLDGLGRDLFNVQKKGDHLYQWLADKFGGKPTAKQQAPRMWKAPREMVAYYGIGDVELTDMLYQWQRDQIKHQDLTDIFKLEMRVLKALLWMEIRGCPVNYGAIQETREKLEDVVEEYNNRMVDLVGFVVNPRSPKQMVQAFETLGIPIMYKASTGNPMFAKDILKSIDHEFTNLILDSRSVGVMINTFLASFEHHICEKTGRIHANINQLRGNTHGTRTGRLSYNDPNLQQVPKRDKDLAKLIRALFIREYGKLWTSADWSQFEFRMFAHYTKDEALLSRFREDPTLDFHQATADLTGLKRNPFAKQLNLGLVFGMGEGLMAKNCGLPYRSSAGKKGKVFYEAGIEAQKIFSSYHSKLPGVKRMLKQAEAVAKKRGYVRTILGRKLRFPDPNYAYKAAGYIFQGSSADMMKKKLVELSDEFEGTDVELLIAVHDEFDFLTPEPLVPVTEATIGEIMNTMPELRIPITSDINSAENWWEASK